MRRAQAGDREALGGLLMAEQAACFRFALRLTGSPADAEDVCQDALLRACRGIAGCRPSGSFRSWLLRIVLCAHRDRLEADRARGRRERRWGMERGRTQRQEPGAELERRELKQRVETLLAGLEDAYRLPIALHYEQGLKYSEVAAVLDMPEGTVATNIRRGLERLREMLQSSGLACAGPALAAALQGGPAVAVPAGLTGAIRSLTSSGPGLPVGGAPAAAAGKGALAAKAAAGLALAGALAATAALLAPFGRRGLPAAGPGAPVPPRASGAGGPALLPRPRKMEAAGGTFALRPATAIAVEKGSAEIKAIGRYLAERLSTATGFKIEVREAAGEAPAGGSILLTTAGAKAELGEEGYQLAVSSDSAVLRAPAPCGLFRGVQTIRQLLPPEIESPARVAGVAWTMPCVRIEDQPRFPWRGLLLDVGRNFYDKEQIKRYIDLLAYHRMNVLHWHLTEHCGWRLEIRKHPRLTGVCGLLRSSPGKRHAFDGFYSQADVREVVAYAKARYVMVVPEIDMPGHICVGRVYPELFCDGKGGGPLCPGNEKTFQFIEEVLSEVAELFPAPYIHIGADEVGRGSWKNCPRCQERMRKEGLKDDKELQRYFVGRASRIVASKGRRMIAWNEAMEGGAPPGAIIETWCCPLRDAVGRKHQAIGTGGAFYFTNPVGPGAGDLRKAWETDLAPAAGYGRMPPEQAGLVLGGEGCLWTDNWRADTPASQADSQIFPRLCGVAEALWTPPEARGKWEDYVGRQVLHAGRLRLMGVAVGPSGCDEIDYLDAPVAAAAWTPAQVPASFGDVEWDVSRFVARAGQWEVRPAGEKGGKNGLDISCVSLLEDGTEVARDEHRGFTGWCQRNNAYRLELKERKPGASYRLRLRTQGSGGTDSSGTVWLGRLR